MSPTLRQEDIQLLVLGDVSVDTLLVPLKENERGVPLKENERGMGQQWWRHRRRGGVWLLEDIIEMALAEIRKESNVQGWGNSIAVHTYDKKEASVDNQTLKSTLDKQYWGAAAILSLFPKVRKGLPGDKDSVYRVEQLLGWAHSDKDDPNTPYQRPLVTYKQSLNDCLKRHTETTRKVQGAENQQDIIVLHDAARDFRDLDPDLLRSALELQYKKDATWILWQMSTPLLKDSALWQTIRTRPDWLKRTILVVRVECLRRLGANMPDVISLEQESENFERLMEAAKRTKEDTPLKRLTEVGHIVVHFRRQGVLHYHNSKDPGSGKSTSRLETSCYFCPEISDDPSSRKLGIMVGFNSILVAAIVRGITWELIHKREDMSKGIIAGIKQGVVLDHLHFLHGYGDGEGEKAILTQPQDPTPYDRLFKNFTTLNKNGWKADSRKYHLAAIGRLQNTDSGTWSRIEYFINRQWKKVDPSGMQWKTIDDYAQEIARMIVRGGIEGVVVDKDDVPGEDPPGTPPLKVHCPFEVHGKIKTAFRDEIDNFASIRLIIEKYLGDKNWPTPLSIAVFGPPGSGKSFTIEQILNSVNAGIIKRQLKYNMSQFNDPKDLETVFHKVQNEAVAGDVPLVFFDEFDAENLKWLKFFLAPMQDGEFKAGDSTYQIGRAIFVFAGGIAKSWSEFYDHQKGDRSFKAAKGTDFVSRLRGYLDIESINPPNEKEEIDGVEYQVSFLTSEFTKATGPPLRVANSKTVPKIDKILMFRRAVLLRSLLEHRLKDIFEMNMSDARIEDKVIHAFLNVKRYEHESRSMQAIIDMSRISSGGHFQEASLPARDQLEMHVDAEEFHRLLREYAPAN
jgi:hypothetical protein